MPVAVAAEERLHRGRRAPPAGDRQAEEDRQAGDRAEEEDLCCAHLLLAFLPAVVRVTLHTRRSTIVAGSVGAPGEGWELAQGHSVDEYLETIYFLAFPIGEYRPKTGGNPTLASRVAEMLGVSRASAGEMLRRLETEGLIERGAQKEALLTPAGPSARRHVVRKHRIVERLLTDFMGYTAAEAHVHADEIGEAFSDDMVARIEERLGHPDRCPHGWPVEPDVEQAENKELVPLSDLEPGRPADDRAPRRARRRPPALVLRRGARARDARRAARGAAGGRAAHGRRQRHRARDRREGRRGPVRQGCLARRRTRPFGRVRGLSPGRGPKGRRQ